MAKYWFRIALFDFLVAASIGLLLRFAFVWEIPGLDFRNLMHAHSHVAMLGWLYIGISVLLVRVFVPEHRQSTPSFLTAFLIAQVSVIGMLVSFLVSGYGPFSIFFSTVHGLASYFFVYRLARESRSVGLAGQMLRGALFFLVFSTLALWAMPAIIWAGWQGKAIYYMAVQFYLHFQFNGWFIFSALALFLEWLRQQGFEPTKVLGHRFFLAMVVSTLLTYALAITWSNPSPALFAVNSTGVVVQLAALILFGQMIRHMGLGRFPNLPALEKFLFALALASFILKILVQSAVVVPHVAVVSYTIRNFVIGFFHLILLGAMTMTLLGLSSRYGLIRIHALRPRLGVWFLFCGFLCSELLLMLQGLLFWAELGFMPGYYEALAAVSALMPVGIGLLLLGQLRT